MGCGGRQAHFGMNEILLLARLNFYLFFVCVTAAWVAEEPLPLAPLSNPPLTQNESPSSNTFTHYFAFS